MMGLIGAALGFVTWVLGLVFKPKPAFDQGRQAGATEVQKSETENALKRTVDADNMRDLVKRLNADELRADGGNLYRD